MRIKNLRILILLFIASMVYSCGTLKEGFKNQKKNNSDEFLVEKKSPLVMPPDYGELPLPNSNLNKKNDEDNSIKSLISKDKDSIKSSDNNENFEESLLKKIKSN